MEDSRFFENLRKDKKKPESFDSHLRLIGSERQLEEDNDGLLDEEFEGFAVHAQLRRQRQEPASGRGHQCSETRKRR